MEPDRRKKSGGSGTLFNNLVDIIFEFSSDQANDIKPFKNNRKNILI